MYCENCRNFVDVYFSDSLLLYNYEMIDNLNVGMYFLQCHPLSHTDILDLKILASREIWIGNDGNKQYIQWD